MSTQLQQQLSTATVRELSDRRDEPAWLTDSRVTAVQALSELALPDVIETPGRQWTDLQALEFETLVDPADETAATTTYEHGDDVVVESIQTALDTHEELLEEHLGATLDPTTNYLTALSMALFQTGTLVYVPAGVDAETITIETEPTASSAFAQTLVVAEESANVTVIERIKGDAAEERRYVSNIVEVVAGENATVQYGAIQDLSEQSYLYTHKRGAVETYGHIDWIEGNFGSGLTRSDVETDLNGDSSETQILGAFFGRDEQHFDINARVWHHGAHTTADLVTRGVLDNHARSVYEGLQHVGTDAWDTSSYQREKTLMLSETAEADASPKLIINNHDTEASHSASVGQVDAEELFYMESRAVDEQTATDMLVEGFFVPLLADVDIEPLTEELSTLVADRLGQ